MIKSKETICISVDASHTLNGSKPDGRLWHEGQNKSISAKRTESKDGRKQDGDEGDDDHKGIMTISFWSTFCTFDYYIVFILQ